MTLSFSTELREIELWTYVFQLFYPENCDKLSHIQWRIVMLGVKIYKYGVKFAHAVNSQFKRFAKAAEPAFIHWTDSGKQQHNLHFFI